MNDFFTDTPDATTTPIFLLATDDVEGWASAQESTTGTWLKANNFSGKEGQKCSVPLSDGSVGCIVAGVGDALSGDTLLAVMGGLAESLPAGTYALETKLEAQEADLAAIGWGQGSYRFEHYGKPGKDAPTLAWPANCGQKAASIAIEAAALTRTLVDIPANDMGPEELALAASSLANDYDAACRIIVGDDLLAQNFPAIHAVGRGSDRAPRLIDITWGDEAAPKVTLVGKGVCYDTGGYNLKPGNSMALMKKDMGGAAHMLGLAQMIMANKLPVRLRLLIPAVENSVSGNAYRPGDVIETRKGLHVEIGNTDAEGRVVLSDALALASEEEPDLLIDFATLTGAARSALGPDVPPFFTDDGKLARALADQSTLWSDPLWRLPLWSAYKANIKSTIGDIRNDGGPFAGAITAALFLQHFVPKDTRWVHFDIYAWNPTKRPGRKIGAAAQCLRAVYGVIEQSYGADR
jgi:leucyl aminopeptidase